jgi:hypothetical protein
MVLPSITLASFVLHSKHRVAAKDVTPITSITAPRAAVLVQSLGQALAPVLITTSIVR